MRKLIAAAALVSTLLLGACSTIEGVGKDISAVGRAITGSAPDVSH
jgi:predicted small secreted protein